MNNKILEDTASESIIFVDKYKPKKLDDIIGNETIIKRLKILSTNDNMPNLILTGQSGVGKTITALCFLKEMLSKEPKRSKLSNYVLELNASDDLRKIDIIQKKVKSFIQKKSKYNIVLLDEFDNMINQTQYVLRSLMDIYSNNSKFILICNNENNIIESIKSRCLILKYNKISHKNMKMGLQKILKSEKINMSSDAIDSIIECSDGDYRKAINDLQTVITRFYDIDIITKNEVYHMLDKPYDKEIKNILNMCFQCQNIKEILPNITNLNIKKGYTLLDVINTMGNVCKDMDMEDEVKIKFIEAILHCHIKIVDGLNTLNQITGLISKLCQINMKNTSPGSLPPIIKI